MRPAWTRADLEGTVNRADLFGGSILVEGQGVVDAVGTVTLRAGGAVTLDADATVATLQTVLRPNYRLVEREVQVVVDTVRVAAGTTLVPLVSYVDTQITEQVGTERVVVGSRYETMNVTLSQIGYYNPNAPLASRFLEVLVEGEHYFNDGTRRPAGSLVPIVDWTDAGNEQVPVRSVPVSDRPSGDYTQVNAATNRYLAFTQLSDAQRWAVLNSTGYMPIYQFDYTNWKLNQTINGTASQLSEGYIGSDGQALYPSWKPGGTLNPQEVFYVDVANWRDKYIVMPTGAQEAILSVASQG